MASTPGLKRVLFCNLNTLTTATPEDPIALGFRGEGTVNITPFKTVKEQGGGDLPNMRNFKFEAESYQATMRMLDKMRQWVNLNCDVEVMTAKQPSVTTPKSDILQFTGNNLLGLGFEYNLSGDKRSLKVMCEGAFPEEAAKSIIDQASTNTAATVATITNSEGNNMEFYKPPYLAELTWGGTNMVEKLRDIISYSFTIKTIAEKDIYNSDIVNKLEFSLELTTRDASIQKMVEAINSGRSLALALKQYNNGTGTLYDKFDFAPGSIIRADESSIGDKQRQLKITFKREVAIYDLEFKFGDTFGGDATDTKGEKGGTCKIGY